jgi:hypothetical protein
VTRADNEKTAEAEAQKNRYRRRPDVAGAGYFEIVERGRVAIRSPVLPELKMYRTSKPKPRVPRTRNAGSETEAAFWNRVRSLLRREYTRTKWLPATAAWARHTRKRGKLLHVQCLRCRQWFPKKDGAVVLHHVVPCGSLRCAADVGPFIERLWCEEPEPDTRFWTVCKPCHAAIHEELKKESAK